ncbi:MAG TPA: SDR family NAD(P)-dependent oxidoreductase [Polyangiaceae bacterium]
MAASFACRYGAWALIAGASEGLGAAFADALASRGLNLVLLARRAELLGKLKARLQSERGVEVRTEVCDLGGPDLPGVLGEVPYRIVPGVY